MLICEGKCNPDLAEYDQLCDRFAIYGDNLDYLRERRKELRHTLHYAEGYSHFDIHMGWVERYTCLECGRVKKI